MEINTAKFPTEREIQETEKRLAEMRARREEAKQLILQAFKSGEVVNSLSPNEAMVLMKQLQARLHGARSKTRGSPVSPELKSNLEAALKAGNYTLSQMEKMFGLSISYISRIKQEMRNRGELPPVEGVINAYDDTQMDSQKSA
jgi:hypothetical protein